MPALFIRISRRFDCAENDFAASAMDEKDVRSSFKNVIWAAGTAFLISTMVFSAFDGVRAARYICAGLCFASCRTVSAPRPVFPGTVLARREWTRLSKAHLRTPSYQDHFASQIRDIGVRRKCFLREHDGKRNCEVDRFDPRCSRSKKKCYDVRMCVLFMCVTMVHYR